MGRGCRASGVRGSGLPVLALRKLVSRVGPEPALGMHQRACDGQTTVCPLWLLGVPFVIPPRKGEGPERSAGGGVYSQLRMPPHPPRHSASKTRVDAPLARVRPPPQAGEG